MIQGITHNIDLEKLCKQYAQKAYFKLEKIDFEKIFNNHLSIRFGGKSNFIPELKKWFTYREYGRNPELIKNELCYKAKDKNQLILYTKFQEHKNSSQALYISKNKKEVMIGTGIIDDLDSILFIDSETPEQFAKLVNRKLPPTIYGSFSLVEIASKNFVDAPKKIIKAINTFLD